MSASRIALVAVTAATFLLAGCGKYGRPVRQPPKPRDQAALGATDLAPTGELTLAEGAGRAANAGAGAPAT